MPGRDRRKGSSHDEDLVVMRGAAILKAQMNMDRLGASPLALQYTFSSATTEFSDPFAKQRSNQEPRQEERRQNSVGSFNTNPAEVDQRSFGEYIDDEAASFFDYFGGESYGEELEYCGDVVEAKEDIKDVPDVLQTSYTFAERGNLPVVVTPDGKFREHGGRVDARTASSSTSSSSSSSQSDQHVLSTKELGRLSDELQGLGVGDATSKARRKPSVVGTTKAQYTGTTARRKTFVNESRTGGKPRQFGRGEQSFETVITRPTRLAARLVPKDSERPGLRPRSRFLVAIFGQSTHETAKTMVERSSGTAARQWRGRSSLDVRITRYSQTTLLVATRARTSFGRTDSFAHCRTGYSHVSNLTRHCHWLFPSQFQGNPRNSTCHCSL